MAVRSIVGRRLESARYPLRQGQPVGLALERLNALAGVPPAHLTARHGIQMREALESIRSAGESAPHLSLPAEAWDLLDRSHGDTGLAALFARRVLAQHAEQEARTAGRRITRAVSSAAARLKARLGQWLLRSRAHRWYAALRDTMPSETKPGFRDYAAWRRGEQEACAPARYLELRAEGWSRQPLISVVMATHNPRAAWLDEAIHSVSNQVYRNWELCICDDGSADPAIRDRLRASAASDARISLVSTNTAQGISRAFNRAAELATGEYLGFLDHDDSLSPEALYRVVEAMQQTDADLIYTDEDFMDEGGERIRPHFKPCWSPRLLDACMYLGHLVVMRRDLFEEVGGFRSERDGAQDYDLVLRASERARSVAHVPHVAYHWRMHNGSVAGDPAHKPHTHEMGRRALEDAARRRGWRDAEVSAGRTPNLFHVSRRTGPASFDLALHGAGASTARPQGARRVIDLTSLDSERGVAAVNAEAANSSADVLVFLHRQLEAVTPDWLTYLMAQFADRATGVVGAKIVTRGGEIDHAGIALGLGDGAGRIGRGLHASAHWMWLNVPREVAAVDLNCLAVRREVFREAGGLDPESAADYRGIDLSLRCRRLGYSVVLETRAVLRAPELAPRKLTPGDAWVHFIRRWRDAVSRPDEYLSPNFRPDSEQLLLC